MIRRGALLGVIASVLFAAGARAAALPPECAATRASLTAPPLESYDPQPGAPRIFAMQFEQQLRNVVSYGAFRTKIDCMLQEYVVPHLATDRPNIVVFNEDVGLGTIATGARGAAARALFGGPGSIGCEPQGVPCATLGALAAVTASYAVPLAAYRLRFPSMGPLSEGFVAATDTVVRSFMGTFADAAKRYGVYMIGSADVPPFVQSSDPLDVATFGDPQVPPSSVYVASGPDVHNEVIAWAPHDVRSDGPDVLRNAVAVNDKVPLTPIEQQIGLAEGPASGPAAIANLRPLAVPGTDARLGFATSLPAFTYGNPPPGTDPCSDVRSYYMRCLDKLGANIVIQDEANPGRWTGPDGDGIEQWQPMSWMASTYRSVSDPTVHFAYNVTPMMVGNLADLPFDGQSAITQRGLSGPGCAYVGNSAFVSAEDRPDLRQYAGPQPGFLLLAPWVSPDASRARLRAIGGELAPGSGSSRENGYLETALIADLPLPTDAARPNCNRGSASRRLCRAIAMRTRGARGTVSVITAGRRQRLPARNGHVSVHVCGVEGQRVAVRLSYRTRAGHRRRSVTVLL